jgi:trimeric autotransporter adhesin
MKFRTAIVRSALLIPTIGAVATRAQAQDCSSPCNTNSSFLTRWGTEALSVNSGGLHNSAFGYYALRANTTGWRNTAVGSYSLVKNTTQHDNTAVGFQVLRYNTGGYSNTAVGAFSMTANVSGWSNSALGYGALKSNLGGAANTAIGYAALDANTSGYDNTALGSNALIGNTTAVGNTALGSNTLWYAPSNYNTAVGGYANIACNSGFCTHTVAVGYGSVAGPYSTAVGGPAAFSSPFTAPQSFARAFGSYAVAVGNDAQATQNYATAIGSGTRASAVNSMALGSGVTAPNANTVRIGNTSVTSIGGYASFANLSDGRYKTSIKENVPGLAFITKLRPVTFKWDLAKLNSIDGAEPLASDPILGEGREAKARKLNTGFIAQEVEAAARECGYDFSGVVKPENEQSQYQLGYSEFVVPLVKAVQEQQKEIDELRQALRTLATDGRLPNDRLGQGSAQATWQHAGMLDNFWAGATTLLSAALVVLHFRRRGASPALR